MKWLKKSEAPLIIGKQSPNGQNMNTVPAIAEGPIQYLSEHTIVML